MMNRTFISCLFLSLYLAFSALGQSVLHQGGTAVEDHFQLEAFRSYLDTIIKYKHSEPKLVNLQLVKCKELLAQGLQLPAEDQLNFSVQLISHELCHGSELNAYQIIQECQELLLDDSISKQLKNTLRYLRGYTYMVLGDYEYAQTAYYQLIENGKQSSDTSSIIRAMYSLGQLFTKDKKYDTAVQYYLDILELKEKWNYQDNNHPLIYSQLADLYLKTKQYQKTLACLNWGQNLLDKYDKPPVRLDYILLKGKLAVEMADLPLAEQMLIQADTLAKTIESKGARKQVDYYLIDLLIAKGMYRKALDVLEELYLKGGQSALESSLELCEKIHDVSFQLADYKKAYEYAIKSKNIQQRINAERKLQQTEYLKLKHETEQQNKENKLLAAQVLHDKAEKQFLYTLISACFLLMVILFGAFYQKRQYNKSLKSKVQKRTQELELTNRKLKQTNKELDEFNRILSHDLKEPLRSIVGFSSLAKREVMDNPKLKEYMTYVEKGGRQLNKIINDVSVFQRIGNYIIHPPQWVETRTLIRKVTKGLQAEYERKTLTVEMSLMPRLYINKSILTLVFQHLFENALKYNEHPEPRVKLFYRQLDDMHSFLIEDNGIGIDLKYQEQIFGMFKRLHYRQKYEGSGLGLSIVRKMVEKVGGTVRLVISQEHKGSVFEVCLPVIQPEVSEEKEYMTRWLT